MNADRNLLFGILALQLDFISREALVAAMNAWVLAKDRSLGEILLEQDALSQDRHNLLEALVQEHLKQHGDDPQRSLAAVSSVKSVREKLAQIADPDVHASLVRVSAGSNQQDPYSTDATGTVMPGVAASTPTSSGLRFRILRPHAKGGLGEVFVASDEELHREVALKQIQERHAHHPEIRARFLMEAEITGGLEHPGIVPVYGLGTYADGRPYYAMRFVRGDSLKDAIEQFHEADRATGRDPGERSLALRNLLGRFVDVCNAIEYAHSRGVLHRDLKPGNIMLGKYGETLVVDWGLAKPVGRPEHVFDSAENTLRPSSASGSAPTEIGAAMGTPAYMSPEQAAGRLNELGPSSDVYSLGATLYSLLAGKPPFESAGADRDVLLRRVQQGEFLPPRRAVGVSRPLQKRIPAALEAICLKAMALASADRYASPRALADDVEHWLADEPVTAYRESLRQRMARFARRRRAWTQAAAAALVVTAAISVVAALLVNDQRRAADQQRQLADNLAREKEQIAEREKIQRERADATFQQARQAVDEFYTQVSENKLLNVPGLQPLRRELLGSALAYYQQFIKERGDDPKVRAELARAFFRLGAISSEIGSKEDAIKAYETSAEIFEQLVRDNPEMTSYQSDLAANFRHLGVVQWETHRLDKAELSLQKALDIQVKLVAKNPQVTTYQGGLALVYSSRANLQDVNGQRADAESSYQQALAIQEKLVHDNPNETVHQSNLAVTYNNLALLQSGADTSPFMRRMTRLPEAESNHQKSLAIRKKLARENPNVSEHQLGVAASYHNLANFQRATGRNSQAVSNLQKAVAVEEALARDNPSVTDYQRILVMSYGSLAGLQRQTGQAIEAASSCERAIDACERLVSSRPESKEYDQMLEMTYDRLPVAQWASSRLTEAESSYRKAIEFWQEQAAKNAGEPGIQQRVGRLLGCLAKVQSLNGRPWTDVQKSLDAARQAARDHWLVAIQCGDVLAMDKRWSEAADQYQGAVEAGNYRHDLMCRHAMLQLAAGDNAGYRSTCRDLVARHAKNATLSEGFMIVLTCVLGEHAVDDWKPVEQLAQKIAQHDRYNPVFQVMLGGITYYAGRPEEALKVLRSAIPLHPIASLAVPDYRDEIRLSWVSGEILLAFGYRDLGKSEDARRAVERARQLIVHLESSRPQYDDLASLWALPVGIHLAKRKLAVYEQSPP